MYIMLDVEGITDKPKNLLNQSCFLCRVYIPVWLKNNHSFNDFNKLQMEKRLQNKLKYIFNHKINVFVKKSLALFIFQ